MLITNSQIPKYVLYDLSWHWLKSYFRFYSYNANFTISFPQCINGNSHITMYNTNFVSLYGVANGDSHFTIIKITSGYHPVFLHNGHYTLKVCFTFNIKAIGTSAKKNANCQDDLSKVPTQI
jgi:hypothetical protein